MIDHEVGFAERKSALDQLFLLKRDSAAFREQERETSLLIGSLFDTAHKDAVFRYLENDSVARVFVLRQSAGQWDTIVAVHTLTSGDNPFIDFIEINDFNGDGIPDLKIIKQSWNTHTGERADLWLYANNRFSQVQDFDDIVSAAYDKNTNLIYSYQSTGCADMAMYFGVFKIEGNKVKRVQEMYCDCCQPSSDSCSIAIMGEKPYKVPYKEAYKHVPVVYADGVKGKCEM